MAEVGSVEVEVRANVDAFEKQLESAFNEILKFESRAKQLFGGISTATQKLSKDMDMTARSTRLFTSEMDKAAQQVVADLAKIEAQRKSMAAAFTQKLNLSLGLGGPGTDVKARAADIQAYGTALDDLRARFVPLFAIQKQYQQSVDEINAAQRVGAFQSVEEYNDALLRQKAIYESNAQAAQRLGNTLKVNSLQMGNVAAQFNDIAVTMAMGMNSWQIALQQGTQLNQVFAGMNFKNIGSTLAGAFKEVVSPVSLATIAIIGLGGMAVQWIVKMMGETEKLSEALKKQADIVKDLGNAYGDVAKAAKDAQNAQAGLFSFSLRSGQNIEQMRLGILRELAGKGEGENAPDRFFTSIGTIRRQGGQAGGMRTPNIIGDLGTAGSGYRVGLQLDKEFRPFQDAIVKFMESVQKGKPDVIAFRKAVSERWGLDRGNAELTQAAQTLLKLTDSSIEAAEKIRELDLIIRRLFDTVGPNGRLLSQGLISKEDAGNLGLYNSQLEITLKRMREIAAIDIAAISARSPQELADIARRRAEADRPEGESPQERRLRIQQAATQALTEATYNLTEAERVARRGREQDLTQGQLNIDLVGRTAGETAKLQYQFEKLQEAQNTAEDNHVKLSQATIDHINATAAAYGKLIDQLTIVRFMFDSINDLQSRSRQAQLDISLVGRLGPEAESARIQFELINKAMRDNITLNDAQRDAIKKLADEYAAWNDQLKKTQLQFDILTERQEIFMKDSERSIRERVRGAGIDPDANPALMAQLRYNQELERTRDTWQEVFDQVNSGVDTIVDALFEGTDSWEETLKKIGRDFARMMFDLAITNPLKNWLTGGEAKTIADLFPGVPGMSSGRGGGFGGALGGLIGGAAKGTIANPVAVTIVGGLPGVPGLPGGGGGGPDEILKKVLGPNTPESSQKVLDQLGSPLGKSIDQRVDSIITSGFKSAGKSATGVDLAWITTKSGLKTKVDAAFAGRFQKLVDQLETGGYPIKTISGYQGVRMTRGPFGTGRTLSQHSFGRAVDINAAENLYRVGAKGTYGRYGVDPSRIARTSNLEYGGDWRSAQDTMHFDVPRGGPLTRAMPGDTGSGIQKAAESVTQMSDVALKAAESLKSVGLSGFEAVKGLTDAAGGLTQFGKIVSQFMAPGGGSGASWFQNLIGGVGKMFGGGAAGAIGYMQSISPAATANILAGVPGLYHTGGIVGAPSTRRIVDMSMFRTAARFAGGGAVSATGRGGFGNLGGGGVGQGMGGDWGGAGGGGRTHAQFGSTGFETHSGLRRNEVPAILHRGEVVFTSMDHARRVVASQIQNAVTPPPTWSANNAFRQGNNDNGLGGGSNLSAKIVNVLDPSIIGQYLSTTEGEKLIVNIMRRTGRGGGSSRG